MSDSTDPADLATEVFGDLFELLDGLEEPADRLRTIAVFGLENFLAEISRRRVEAVLEARSAGASWRKIGELLGVSPQRAHNIATRGET